MVVKGLLERKAPPILILACLLTLWNTQLSHSVEFWLNGLVSFFCHRFLCFRDEDMSKVWISLWALTPRTEISWSCSQDMARYLLHCGVPLANSVSAEICVYMLKYIYIYIYIHTYDFYLCTNIHACMHGACMKNTYMHSSIHPCMHTTIHTYMYCKHALVRTFIHICTHANICSGTQSCIHAVILSFIHTCIPGGMQVWSHPMTSHPMTSHPMTQYPMTSHLMTS